MNTDFSLLVTDRLLLRKHDKFSCHNRRSADLFRDSIIFNECVPNVNKLELCVSSCVSNYRPLLRKLNSILLFM